jgi:hypothetical protein
MWVRKRSRAKLLVSVTVFFFSRTDAFVYTRIYLLCAQSQVNILQRKLCFQWLYCVVQCYFAVPCVHTMIFYYLSNVIVFHIRAGQGNHLRPYIPRIVSVSGVPRGGG